VPIPTLDARRTAWVLRAFAWTALFASLAGGSAHALTFQPPRFTREQMEAALAEAPRWRFVYGTLDPQAEPLLRQRAMVLARRLFGGDSTQVEADRDLTEAEIAASSVLLLGGPRENLWSGRLAPAFPVRFREAGFEWQGRLYDRPGDALHLSYPNPLAPRRFVLLIAGNSPGAIT